MPEIMFGSFGDAAITRIWVFFYFVLHIQIHLHYITLQIDMHLHVQPLCCFAMSVCSNVCVCPASPSLSACSPLAAELALLVAMTTSSDRDAVLVCYCVC